MKPKIVVSACLLGENCKYNGGNNYNESVVRLSDKYDIIPICPERSGGLEIPRFPAEIIGQGVYLKDKTDVTDNFIAGARLSLETAIKNDCKIAVLKWRSPSCSSGEIYDGSFSKKVIKGDGITARLFKENGITVLTEKEIEKLL